MTDASTDGTGDDFVIRAGEYALGVLEGEERAAALRETLRGGEFSRAVAWWDRKLAHLGEDAGTAEPSQQVWPAILSRIGGQDRRDDDARNPAPARRLALSGWKLVGAMVVSGALAASLAAIVLQPTPQVGPAQGPVAPVAATDREQLIAAASGAAQESLAARIDPQAGALHLELVGLEPQDRERLAAELWVVPAGGAPVSLGLVPGEGRFTRDLTSEEIALLADGATLAVTIEDRADAPHPAPTTPILVAGTISRI